MAFARVWANKDEGKPEQLTHIALRTGTRSIKREPAPYIDVYKDTNGHDRPYCISHTKTTGGEVVLEMTEQVAIDLVLEMIWSVLPFQSWDKGNRFLRLEQIVAKLNDCRQRKESAMAVALANVTRQEIEKATDHHLNRADPSPPSGS